jgi:UDP-N-acetylglucosamine acyltransferase
MIHATAIIDPSAHLHASVRVGPWTTIGANVEIGADTVVESHVVIKGHTRMGAGNRIFQFSSIGEDTPDLKYNGEQTSLTVGDNNIFREGVTVHRGTVQDRGDTLIGDGNLLMAYAHVGHDCVIGNNTILVNNAVLAGHVIIDDWAIIGGYAGVHQYCNIGAHSFVGGMTKVTQDVPAFVIAEGHPAIPRMINIEGLKRRGYSKEDIKQLQQAYKILYRRKLSFQDALSQLQEMAGQSPCVADFVASIESSQRGIIRP